MYIPIDEMRGRFQLLGLKQPISLTLLPLNFDAAESNEVLLHSPISKEIERLLAQHGVTLDALDSRQEDRLYLDNRSSDIFLPVLIFTWKCITENPDVISATLELIADYLREKFDKLIDRPKVRFRYLRGHRDVYELIEYDGPLEGLSEIRKLKSKDDKDHS